MSAEVNIFEGSYDPSYLNLDANNPDDWEIYANKIRDLFVKVLKLPRKDSSGYRVMKEF